MKKKAEPRNIAGVSSEAIRAKTGKDWQEWFALLDKTGARKMDHKTMAAYLYERLGCPGWWNQMVAVGYEQERGLRKKHEKPSGYEISGSKTIAVPVARLYQAWENRNLRGRWLEETALVVRKATPRKSMRITWADGKTSVDVNFYAKGSHKSQVAVQHGKLANAKEAERKKAYWAEKLERLKGILEQQRRSDNLGQFHSTLENDQRGDKPSPQRKTSRGPKWLNTKGTDERRI